MYETERENIRGNDNQTIIKYHVDYFVIRRLNRPVVDKTFFARVCM